MRLQRLKSLIVRWTLGRYVNEAEFFAGEAMTVAYLLLTATEGRPDLHLLVLRLLKPLTWLCRTLEQAVGQSRVSSGAETPLQLHLPFAHV